MGATFDPELLHTIGLKLLAPEAKLKAASLILAPTCNIQRVRRSSLISCSAFLTHLFLEPAWRQSTGALPALHPHKLTHPCRALNPSPRIPTYLEFSLPPISKAFKRGGLVRLSSISGTWPRLTIRRIPDRLSSRNAVLTTKKTNAFLMIPSSPTVHYAKYT